MQQHASSSCQHTQLMPLAKAKAPGIGVRRLSPGAHLQAEIKQEPLKRA